ncbi:liprin-alpha-1-like isoform X1 [Bos indicus]|uniref:Liprin-alpha-1-like isoform X1 n=1 Tax=Bos indicus TaxID=9915 RepID=A0ABM4RIK5_BOSIN
MSCQRQGRRRPLPVPGGHLVRHLPPHTVVLRLIEEEKENTEQRAEETESREGRGSLGSLRRFKSVSSLNLLPTSLHAGSCPPLPKPRRRWHSPAQEGDQLGIMTLGDTRSSLSEDQGVLYGNHCERMTLELRLPAIREEVGDDKTTIKCETSTPALPLSLRLGRLHTGALRTATHEDLRDAHKLTPVGAFFLILVEVCPARGMFLTVMALCLSARQALRTTPGTTPAAAPAGRTRCTKPQRKRASIKSSISCLFRKKEKGRPEHPNKEALGPGGCFTVQREEGLQASPFCVSPVVPTRLQSLTLGVLLGAGAEEGSVFSMGLR